MKPESEQVENTGCTPILDIETGDGADLIVFTENLDNGTIAFSESQDDQMGIIDLGMTAEEVLETASECFVSGIGSTETSLDDDSTEITQFSTSRDSLTEDSSVGTENTTVG